ncbi:dual specificity protein phosphatase 10-like [Hydra vulgaris]|uniref:protein-tyrosine-phosphatase n=1 Tax=Hydra vulgaris TaxID=6087 RepID=A0ABM4BAC4_HYDVU
MFGLIVTVMTPCEISNDNYDIKNNMRIYNSKFHSEENVKVHLIYHLEDSLNTNDLNEYNIEKICAHIDGHLQSADKPNKNVLIHCMAGMNRSVSLIIAYLLRKKEYNELGFYGIKQMILDKRGGQIVTNGFFEKFLLEYEQIMRKKINENSL